MSKEEKIVTEFKAVEPTDEKKELEPTDEKKDEKPKKEKKNLVKKILALPGKAVSKVKDSPAAAAVGFVLGTIGTGVGILIAEAVTARRGGDSEVIESDPIEIEDSGEVYEDYEDPTDEVEETNEEE